MKLKNKIDVNKNSPPVGYNPIEKIRGALFHEISVPFFGEPIWCYVTCLNSIQIQSCGNISCLFFDKDNKNKHDKFSLEEMRELKNAQEALVKLTLVRPSFDEIIKDITDTNFLFSKKKDELEEINKLINSLPPGKRKRKLEKEARQIEFYLGYLLPDDTMSFLTSWALGVNITDIKKLSKEILLRAAIMAKNGNDNPSDHLTGIFTDFQKEDINSHAWIFYNEFLEAKNIEKELKNKSKW